MLRKVSPLLTLVREPVAALMSLGLWVAAPVADRAFDVSPRGGAAVGPELLARPEMRQMFVDDLLSAGRVSFRAMAYDAVLFSRWWGFDVADITTPVYLWHGDDDLVIPLSHGERMAALLPNSRLSVVPGQGHLAMLDAAEEAIEMILAVRDDGRAVRRCRARPVVESRNVSTLEPTTREGTMSARSFVRPGAAVVVAGGPARSGLAACGGGNGAEPANSSASAAALGPDRVDGGGVRRPSRHPAGQVCHPRHARLRPYGINVNGKRARWCRAAGTNVGIDAISATNPARRRGCTGHRTRT